MTDRNASIVDENIETPPSPIDTLEAGFDRDLVGDVENIRFNFYTGGREGGFGLFNGFLIAIKQCDGSTSFDKTLDQMRFLNQSVGRTASLWASSGPFPVT